MGLLARIFPRLLLFNVLLVFLPAAGLLYLDTYERQMLDNQERSMVQQGRVLAAALGGKGPLASEVSVGVLSRLEQRIDSRLRIIDRDGTLLADSSRLGPRRRADAPPPVDNDRHSALYRLGAQMTLLWQRLVRGPAPDLPSGDVYGGLAQLRGPELEAALAGRYGAATRISSGGQRSVTLYSAIPIRDGEQVMGAVLVSQSTARILGRLVEVRLDIFRTFLASVAVAIILSLLFSATIARPLARLRTEASEIVDRRGRLKGRFRASKRRDEIGDLARALETLSRRVEGHQEKLEAFASDVAHELKNPLASVRTATELLSEVEAPADKERFLAMVQHDVARMEHVLSEIRELALLDRERAEPPAWIDARKLTAEVVAGYRLRESPTVAVEFERDATEESEVSDESEVPVAIEQEHLSRVLVNLIDNAISFTPSGSVVEVGLTTEGTQARLTVEDRGPGVPATDRTRVFDRFFTARPPEHPEDGHLGLGLSIVKTIIESYGGRVDCRQRTGGGSSFEVVLPSTQRP